MTSQTTDLPPCGDDLCAPGCTVCREGGPLDQTTPASFVHIARLEDAITTAESEARRYATFYPPSSDGRNTFTMLADRISDIAKAAKEARNG